MQQDSSEIKKDAVHDQATVYVDESNLDIELSTKPPSMIALFWKEIRHDYFALVSLCLLVIVFLVIYVGSVVIQARMDVMQPDLTLQNVSPAGFQQQTVWGVDGVATQFVDIEFPTLLGTDSIGRQVAPLMIVSARNSLNIGLAVTALSFMIGLFVGVVAGFYGGHVDNVIMRITDTWTMLPGLMVVIAMISIAEERSVILFITLLTMFTWMARTRLVRAAALQQCNLDYIAASKTLGTRNIVIIFREMLPNIVDIVVANFVLTMAANIGIETGLTLLGFGLGIEHPSLGTMIQNALVPHNLQFFWWTWAPAMILVISIMLCINFVGNALQRVADPRQRLV